MYEKLYVFDFTSFFAERWASLPSESDIRRELPRALLIHSELQNLELGMGGTPDEVRELVITNAAYRQIKIMWHGHRGRTSNSPPPIRLKFFVFGFGQKKGYRWVDIELLPGIDDWGVE